MIKKLAPPWKPNGLALTAFINGDKSAAIGIHMDDDSVTYMPIEIYFRSEEEFPEIEKLALTLCKGKILDVGAGAGAHSLVLQDKGFEVKAIDIDSDSVKIMAARGVKNATTANFLKLPEKEKFDTLLFLMNGIGIAGDLSGLSNYLEKAKKLLEPNGQIILDSSDLRNGETELDLSIEYFGVFDYQLEFEDSKGEHYNWLYIDQEKLNEVSEKAGYSCKIIYEQEDGGFLAKLVVA